MAEWKMEIINLAKDFCVPKAIYKGIINHVETHDKDTVPVSYHKNRDKYLYNMAQRELKKYLWQVLV